MTYQGLLPIGSVVMLRNDDENHLMITGYAPRRTDNGKLFDYCACVHPVGVISTNQNLLFNHDQIEKICHIGFINDKTCAMLPQMEKVLAELRAEEEEKTHS